jgi:hypothetical protein
MLGKLSKKITRRNFLKNAGKGGIIIGGTAVGIGTPTKAVRSWSASYCYTPHQRETMECIADTAVPPTEDDGPGASEARSWELIKDPFYGVGRFIPFITWDIDCFCYRHYRKRFIDLDYEDREEVLLDREVNGGLWGTLAPAYRMTINVAKIAFFGGVINRVGTDYVGFPYEWWTKPLTREGG